MDPVHYLENEAHRWEVLRSYFLRYGTIGPQVSSFEHFCDVLMPQIIQEQSTIYVECPQKKRCDTFCFSASSSGTVEGITINRPQYVDEHGQTRKLTPDMAMLMRKTYDCSVRVAVHHTIEFFETEELSGEPLNVEKKKYENIPLFDFPCMLRSKYCHWHRAVDVDPSISGGGFIINGHDKCVIELQKMRTNFPVTRILEWDDHKPQKRPLRTLAEVRAASEKWRSTSTVFVNAKRVGGMLRVSLYLQVPFITRGTSSIDIPLCCVLKLLHVETFEEQLKLIVPDPTAVDPRVLEILRFTLREPQSQMTRAEVFAWLAAEGTVNCKEKTEAKKRAYVEHIFSSEFFPQIGVAGLSLEQPEQTSGGRWGGRMRQFRQAFDPEKIKEECHRKAVYLGMVVTRLVHVHLQLLPQDDRDHYSNKRLDAPGPLFALHFRMNYRAFLRQLPSALLSTIQRCPSIIDTIKAKAKQITINMHEPFRSGAWSLQPNVNTGVVQAVPRLSPYTAMAHMRRIMTALKKEGKIPTPRQLHLSQWGYNCAIETPEGQQCGLILVLTMLCQVSKGVPTSTMTSALFDFFGHDLLRPIEKGSTVAQDFIVLVNGTVVGTTRRPAALEKELIAMRRNQDVPYELRIVWPRRPPMSKYFCINTENSVAIRPLFVVENLAKVPPLIENYKGPPLFDALMREGCIEFIDSEEKDARELLVAVRARDLASGKPYTHLEVDPTAILGMMAQMIPFSNHNQSPRDMYYTSMGKQAVSIPCLTYRERVDMHMYCLDYCQRSLVATKMDRFLVEQSGDVPNGASVIWAVSCMDGYNMEDSIYIKRQAIERGLFNMTYYRTYVAEIKSRGNEEEGFQIPPETAVSRKGACDYSKLGPDGIVPEGTPVVQNDVLIGKVCRINDEFDKDGNQISRVHDRSVVMSKMTHGVVDKVIHVHSGFNGKKIVWVKVRQARTPQVGDKFACYTPDHDVLTSRGWVPVADVTMDDRCATLDPLDSSFRYEEVEDVIEYRVSKIPTVEVENAHVSLKTTANHSMYCAFDHRLHDQIGTDKKAYNVFDPPYRLVEGSKLIGKTNVRFQKDSRGHRGIGCDAMECILCGYWWRTGCARTAAGEPILKAFPRPDILKHVPHREVFHDAFKIDVYRPARRDFALTSMVFFEGSRDTIPSWAFALDRDGAFAFLHGIFMASPSKVFEDKAVVDHVQRLGIHAGIASTVRRLEKGWKVVLRKSYESRRPKVSVKESPNVFSGTVHCVTVPTGILCVRRKGKAVWCGNSRHGQKGTVGCVIEETDMPFCPFTGMTPDIILNPHAIPSRMTVGNMIECLVAKKNALEGIAFDDSATTFEKPDLAAAGRVLAKHGYDAMGKQHMISGVTGEPLDARIFMGPVYYHGLKHFAADKIHSRAHGPNQVVTRQPTEGRSKNGGIRVGEMEKDGLLSHGAMFALRDRLSDNSDATMVVFCRTCGRIGEHRHSTRYGQGRVTKPFCRGCRRKPCHGFNCVTLPVPFATVLLLRELEAMHIIPKITLKDSQEGGETLAQQLEKMMSAQLPTGGSV